MHAWQDPCRSVDERVDALLADLTLAEQAAQLGSFWPVPPEDQESTTGDVAPMASAFGQGLSWSASVADGLGHITRAFGSAPVTVAEGVARLRHLQHDVVAGSRLGIPAIAHEECLTGLTALGATVYPTPLAWGATFAPDLIDEMAAAIGADMRALGVHQGLAPVLDVVRDYRWGRVEETCGEDPYLVGSLTAGYVRGLEEAGIVATLKHFAGYAAGRGGRNHAPVSMGPREFEDVVLVPFEMALRLGGARSVMNAYSDVDGVPAGGSEELLTTLLRDRWGFTGTVVADYWAITFLRLMHRVVDDEVAAGRLALRAGIDVELPGTSAYATLADEVDAGRLDAALVTRAARRVLRQKVELGLLDKDWDPAAQGGERDLDSPANRALALRLAEESIVLLANDGVLPLTGAPSVALVGPCADDPRTLLGCYSFPNHVMSRYEGAGLGIEVASIADVLRAELGERVWVERGVPVLEHDRTGLRAAVEAAAAADVAVVAVGDLAGLFGRGTSGEGCDAADLALPGLQGELVEEVLATGTPVVLLVVSGRPYALGDWGERCAAVVQTFLPGAEGARAIHRMLTGQAEPGGRLPVGVPALAGGQPGTYLTAPLGWYSEGISNLDPRPAFCFGHGLSYTTFELADLAVSAPEMPTDGTVDVSVTVANTGDRAGSHVVQLYLSDPVAQVTRPVKQLIGFAKVRLAPGERRTVTFAVHADRTSFTGTGLRRVVEPGDVELSVGHSSEDRPLSTVVTLTGPERVVGEGRVLDTPVTVSR